LSAEALAKAEAIHLAAQRKNGLPSPSLGELRRTSRRFAPLRKRFAFVAGNDGKRSFAIPRRDPPGSCKKLLRALRNQRAQGKPGALGTRSPCAENCTRWTTGTPERPAFPAQWFYGLFRALLGDEFVLSPSSAN
jgi:hypothetical protein